MKPSTQKQGNPHRVSHKPHHHATQRELPDLARYSVAIESLTGEPFDIVFSADRSKIKTVRPLTSAGRALLPEQGIHAWAERRGWWVDPIKQRSN